MNTNRLVGDLVNVIEKAMFDVQTLSNELADYAVEVDDGHVGNSPMEVFNRVDSYSDAAGDIYNTAYASLSEALRNGLGEGLGMSIMKEVNERVALRIAEYCNPVDGKE